MVLRPSTVLTDEEGWTWLAPSRRGAQLRQAFWSVVLSVLLIVLAAAATLPPPWVAVPLVTVVLGAGVWLVRRLWQRAHSAVAVSALGVVVRGGFDTAQIAWPALDAVVALPAGPHRVRILVEGRGARHATAATFAREPAVAWLEACADHARQRRLAPEPLDDLPGFRTG
jgi:hypothetical protein